MSFMLNALKKACQTGGPKPFFIIIHFFDSIFFKKGVTCFFVQEKMLKISHLQPSDILRSLFYSLQVGLSLSCVLYNFIAS
jgi:hypothetical protein